jgi:outer membrane protein assembly factor BamE (lipoprotein component of BamABCDE complex)
VYTPRKRRFVAAVPALGLCCLLIIGCKKDDGKSTATTGNGASGPKVSKANFDKVKDGMSDKEVADILGPPSASAEFDPKVMKDMMKDTAKVIKIDLPDLPGIPLPKMTLKNWEDGDTLYEIVFQEGKVAGKNTATKKEKVTKENADRIKVNMTRAEVEAILGKGKHEAGAKIEGASGDVIIWEGTDGIISVIFTNDKVTATAGWKKK